MYPTTFISLSLPKFGKAASYALSLSRRLVQKSESAKAANVYKHTKHDMRESSQLKDLQPSYTPSLVVKETRPLHQSGDICGTLEMVYQGGFVGVGAEELARCDYSGGV
jgi:hypothetical protein